MEQRPYDPQWELLEGVKSRRREVLDLWDNTDSTLPQHERLRAFAAQANIKAKIHAVQREGDIAEALRTARANALEMSNNLLLMEEACSHEES